LKNAEEVQRAKDIEQARRDKLSGKEPEPKPEPKSHFVYKGRHQLRDLDTAEDDVCKEEHIL
jgi:hypothetical protein